MDFDFPMIGGAYTSWANIAINLALLGAADYRTKDFAALDWDHSLEPEIVPGTGPMPVGATVGIYAANASMTMYFDSGSDFQRALQAANPTTSGIGLAVFDITAHWSPKDNIGITREVRIVGARIKSVSNSNAPGSAAATLVFGLAVTGYIEVDGIRLI